jgi:hypothetical protein
VVAAGELHRFINVGERDRGLRSAEAAERHR